MTTETALKPRGLFLRKLKNFTVIGVSAFGTVIAAVFLIWILWTILRNGAESLSVEFLTQPTKPYGVPGGGMLNAILGTTLITLVATLLAVPAGMLGGVCLSEFARSSRFGNAVRFSANVMMGMPSIIVGLFIYTLIVMTTGRFSGFAGSVALAIIMFPVILRTTEDMLCMVPNALRESALAIGAPRWRITLAVVFRSAKSGLMTGVLLAVARVAGETAPLLFTALTSDAWPTGFFTQPTANLTVTMTEYATNSPFETMHIRAWGAALIITAAVLALNILCRTIFREKKS
ncbi:MAG: phosphate ABC transporter permease PstA [Victivallales bacterium]|nr:phosphate ABC transporter permease PstA [bacterium]MDY5696091.1 phosphate ABC transporter permease PstA [Victivallales bacterium]